jgi:hypothetical protein
MKSNDSNRTHRGQQTMNALDTLAVAARDIRALSTARADSARSDD